MKNLTTSAIILVRQDKSRASLDAAQVTPKLVDVPASSYFKGALEIVIPAHQSVDFTGVDLDTGRPPYIVSKEVFDALPETATDFVTPDYETAVMNGFNHPHVINRFIAKPGSIPTNRPHSDGDTNNQ